MPAISVTKVRALITALAFLCVHGTAGAQERLRIGMGSDYPPFYFMDTYGRPQGFEVDIANAICAEMRAKCSFAMSPRWDHVLTGLLAGRYDLVMASVSITEARKRHMLFSQRYYSSRSSVLALRDIPIDPRRPETMSGRIVGVQAKTTHEVFADRHFGPMNARVTTKLTLSELLLELERREIDAIVADKVALLGLLQRNQAADCCTLIGEDLEDPAILGAGVGAAFRQDGVALKARFDSAFDRVRASGEYDRINDRYFPFDIY
jgi:polar amino acid transport system substrate-binding protein